MGKATKANLNSVVRESLTLAGYSHYLVKNALNASLGDDMSIAKNGVSEDKTGRIKLSGKKEPKLTVSVKPGTIRYECKDALNIVLLFGAWHDGIDDALKVTADFTVTIPRMFTAWLDGFAKSKEQVKEQVTS